MFPFDDVIRCRFIAVLTDSGDSFAHVLQGTVFTTLGQLYDYSKVVEVTVNDIGKIIRFDNKTDYKNQCNISLLHICC